MEYIDGGDLMELILRKNLTEHHARSIARQLLEGLRAMHENNFCHRDLKPQVGYWNLLGLTFRLIGK